MKITLRNDFHNTEIKVIPRDGKLSIQQVKRIRKALCGIQSCACGDILGMRGQDNPEIIADQDDYGRISAYLV